jgi:GT2 family glycosyltransferase
MPIPKIIHQLWIGPKPMPTKFMDTWRDKHPDFEYIRWTEAEIARRGLKLECTDAINRMSEINGKADIIRWEILYQYGGIFLDADSICVEPFDETFLNRTAFAGFENEECRQGLVATGTMGYIPKHPLCRAAVDWMLVNDSCPETCGKRAWYTVGPGLLTRLLETGKYSDFSVYPSYMFLPLHFTGIEYRGHKKIYAFQEWGSTKQNYEIMNQIVLPTQFTEPNVWISVLVASYNTKHMYVVECLDSIKAQTGHFGIELVWINDGSTDLSSQLLEKELEKFQKSTRFTKGIYYKSPENRGLAACLAEGVAMCSHEIIVRMDSDDIMFPDRIEKQLEFMKKNPNCVICGTDVQMFKRDPNDHKDLQLLQHTNHQTMTWDQFRRTKPTWFVNHPSVCFRKSAILEAGNYNVSLTRSCFEDYDLWLRILKKFGTIHHIPEVLMYYRIHSDQVTWNGAGSTPENNALRSKILEDILKE